MTVAHTARKQGKEVLAFLVRSMEAHLNGQGTPLLVEASSGASRPDPHDRIVAGHLAFPDAANPTRRHQPSNRTLQLAGPDCQQLCESRPGLSAVRADQLIESISEFG